ncbi:MAG: putative membrane protein [uncultured Nocardioidaceae bacterium]|uniref:Putative membrane protein n=1 Tax=uncultured Nocardioidaceae bacterium TaxID=253824 RepID=A0A6J4LRG5_9ACTN|nr:MAG: putative membrane protein [uncultured Nocardioidaceae bacterium]
MTVTAPQQRADTGARLQRITPPLAVAGGVLVVSVALHVRDPHQSGSWGFCPWLLLTGTYCPGCGGLRAVNDLTRGDLAGAASSNLMLVSSIPVLGLLWARSFAQRWSGVRRPVPRSVVRSVSAVALAAIAVFAVVRNLPIGSWLAP